MYTGKRRTDIIRRTGNCLENNVSVRKKTEKKEEYAVKILFYDTKSYDKESFEAKAKDYPDIQIEYLKSELVPSTAKLAKGYDAICAFVSSDVGTETIEVLHACGVKLILMRCAGFNNVDVEKAAACGIKVMRVPGYSPEAVAEHAMALALAPTEESIKRT